MDGKIDQAHEQVERPLGTRWHEKLRHPFGGITILGTIVTGLAGLRGETGGVPRVAHADAQTPTIAPVEISASPPSIDAIGTNFAPGAPVHIDLVLAYWHNVPDITPTPDESGNPPVSPVPTATLSTGRGRGCTADRSVRRYQGQLRAQLSSREWAFLPYRWGPLRCAPNFTLTHLWGILLLVGWNKHGDG